jgi:cystathionine beta-synthase
MSSCCFYHVYILLSLYLSLGLLCGGSCGAAIVGALEAAKVLTVNQRCVVLLADSIRNYMSKFLSDNWMYENDFVDDRALNAKNTIYG